MRDPLFKGDFSFSELNFYFYWMRYLIPLLVLLTACQYSIKVPSVDDQAYRTDFELFKRTFE